MYKTGVAVITCTLAVGLLGGCAGDGDSSTSAWSVPIHRGDRVNAIFMYPDGSTHTLMQPGSRIIVYASVNGSPPAPFIVDTGAPKTHILTNVIYGQWGGTPTTTVFPLVGGALQGWDSQVNTFRIGDAVLYNLPVTLVSVPSLAQEGVAGLIGDDVLSQFKVTIDYKARTLSLSR